MSIKLTQTWFLWHKYGSSTVITSQDHQGRRVYQVPQADQEDQEGQEHLVSLELKVNQVLQELDHLDPLDLRCRTQPLKCCRSEKNWNAVAHSHFISFVFLCRVNQVSQGSQEAQDLKELQDLLVSQAYQVDQALKVILASQDSKVGLENRVPASLKK